MCVHVRSSDGVALGKLTRSIIIIIIVRVIQRGTPTGNHLGKPEGIVTQSVCDCVHVRDSNSNTVQYTCNLVHMKIEI